MNDEPDDDAKNEMASAMFDFALIALRCYLDPDSPTEEELEELEETAIVFDEALRRSSGWKQPGN